MGELPVDCRRDLCQLLGRAAEPVESRHERGMQARGDRQCRRRNRGNHGPGGGLALCFQYGLGHLLHKQGDTVATSMMSCRMVADSSLLPTMPSIMVLASCPASRLMMR